VPSVSGQGGLSETNNTRIVVLLLPDYVGNSPMSAQPQSLRELFVVVPIGGFPFGNLLEACLSRSDCCMASDGRMILKAAIALKSNTKKEE
jgi:hypothetical protein